MFTIENHPKLEYGRLTVCGISSPGRYLESESTVLLTKVNIVKTAATKFVGVPWLLKFRGIKVRWTF